MVLKKLVFAVVLLAAIFISCTDRDDDVTMVNIRIQNSTNLFFSEVRVSDRDTVYKGIAAGDLSEYLSYDRAFKNASIIVLTDSTSLNYFPEERATDSLPIGFYTYELSLNTDKQLELTFKIDQ